MEELKNAIIADGKVDAAEVQQLKDVMLADGVIDRAEADVLFEINDACSDADNDPSYNDFFVESITSHVLEDEETPDVIDEAEGDWLHSKIAGDGGIDDLEQRLLLNLQSKAVEIQSDKLNSLIAMVNENANA